MATVSYSITQRYQMLNTSVTRFCFGIYLLNSVAIDFFFFISFHYYFYTETENCVCLRLIVMVITFPISVYVITANSANNWVARNMQENRWQNHTNGNQTKPTILNKQEKNVYFHIIIIRTEKSNISGDWISAVILKSNDADA